MKQKTIVAMILDESTSMSKVKDTAISGVNEFIGQLKQDYEDKPEDGEIYFTLVTFAQDPYAEAARRKTNQSEHESVKFVLNDVNIVEVEEVPATAYNPHGNTPLLEAIGKTIESVDAYLATNTSQMAKNNTPLGDLLGTNKPENDVQYKVIVVIQTDGEENASIDEYKPKSKIADMITDREGRGNWTFVFLGAGIDAIGDGMSLGVSQSNNLSYAHTPQGHQQAYSSVAAQSRSLRGSSLMQSKAFFDDSADEDLADLVKANQAVKNFGENHPKIKNYLDEVGKKSKK